MNLSFNTKTEKHNITTRSEQFQNPIENSIVHIFMAL